MTTSGSKLNVAYPWAWSWCPVDLLPLTEHPDVTDQRTREYPGPVPDWSAVSAAVREAVHLAQNTPLTAASISTTYAPVQVSTPLNPASPKVAKAWLETREPVNWSPSIPQIGGGRHRLWAASRLPGSPSLPIMVSCIGMGTIQDALIDFGDEHYRQGMVSAVLQDLAATRCVLTDPRFALENQVVVRHIDEAAALLNAYQSAPLMSEQEYHARRDS